MKMSKIVAGVLAVACICSTFGVGAYDRNILKDLTSVTMTAKAFDDHAKVYAELGEAGFIYHINDTQRVTIEGYGKVRLDENGEPVDEYGKLIIDPVTPPENLVIPERFFIPEYPNGIKVQEIGESAFEGCDIKTLTIPSEVTQISYRAFADTQLEELFIPYRVKVIETEAFAISTLKTVEFEDNGLYKDENGEWEETPKYENASELKGMGTRVFAGSRITSVRVPKSVAAVIGNYFEAPFDGANYLTEVNFAKGALVIPEKICMNCYALKHIDIPSTVETIEPWAFCNSGLEEVNIPASVETIGDRAFGVDQWWSLGEPQTYSEELVELFPFLKEGYLPLSQVTFLPPENPEQKDINLKTVGNCLFAGSKITTISVPYTIKEVKVGDYNGGMLTDCHFLTSVTLEDGMTKIPERLLLHCGAKKLNVVEIPDTVETIGESAFADTYLKELTIPSSVTTIENHAFYNTLLTEVDIPSNVKTVGNRAFGHDSKTVRTTEGTKFFGPLAKVTLHEGLEFLGQNAFEGSIITSIAIPSTLKEVYGDMYGWGPFDGIDKFDTIWTEGNFTDNMSLRDLKLFIVTDYPSVSVPEDETATWKELNIEDYVNLDVTLAEGTTEIPDNLFCHCSSLKSIIIPDTVEKIGNSAFYNTYLSEIDIPASVKEIGSDAFCFEVRRETLNGQEAEFRSPLTKITLHEGLETINAGAFKGTSIADIYIPSTVQTGGSAFIGMERPTLDEAFEPIKDDDGNITGYTKDKDGSIVEKIKFYIPSDEPDGSAFPDSYQKISAEDYISTYSQLHATLGEGMVTIPYGLFSGCGILTEADVPATVSNVEGEAFYGTSIKEFTLAPSKGTSIDGGAFRDCTALKRITINDPCCDILGDAIPETATIASYHFTDDPADFTTTENYAKSNNNDFESLGDMLFFSDVNDDGAVNLKDVVTIRRYIAYEGDEPREEAVPLNTQRADINQDGTINLKDVVLARRLAASITKN